MDITCQKCGASAAENQAFCSKCGAVIGMADAGRPDDASWNMASTIVGQKLPPSAAQPPPREPAPTLVERPAYRQPQPPAAQRSGAAAAPAPQPAVPTAPAPQPAASGGNKTLYILLGLLALIAVGVVVLVVLLLLLNV